MRSENARVLHLKFHIPLKMRPVISGEVASEKKEEIKKIISYHDLKIKNNESVYRIGMSFLKEIEHGKTKHFGFVEMGNRSNDMTLFTYASFLNLNLEKAILVIVEDFSNVEFDRYREKFRDGALGKWKTKEWGDVCVVDHLELNQNKEETLDFMDDLKTEEFAAVLWSLPPTDLQKKIPKLFLNILNKLSSITYMIQPGITKNKPIEKSIEYFKCFDVKVKGILTKEVLA